jgi:hypothetical protein
MLCTCYSITTWCTYTVSVYYIFSRHLFAHAVTRRTSWIKGLSWRIHKWKREGERRREKDGERDSVRIEETGKYRIVSRCKMTDLWLKGRRRTRARRGRRRWTSAVHIPVRSSMPERRKRPAVWHVRPEEAGAVLCPGPRPAAAVALAGCPRIRRHLLPRGRRREAGHSWARRVPCASSELTFWKRSAPERPSAAMPHWCTTSTTTALAHCSATDTWMSAGGVAGHVCAPRSSTPTPAASAGRWRHARRHGAAGAWVPRAPGHSIARLAGLEPARESRSVSVFRDAPTTRFFGTRPSSYVMSAMGRAPPRKVSIRRAPSDVTVGSLVPHETFYYFYRRL